MTNESEPKIIVDEDWKSKVAAEREQLRSKAEPSSAPRPGGERPFRLPPPTFLTLCESLVAQAMAELANASRGAEPPDANTQASGETADPRLHLEVARHMIDTLAILQAKTSGNLSPDEARYLDQGLHELRMAFVACQNAVGTAAAGKAKIELG